MSSNGRVLFSPVLNQSAKVKHAAIRNSLHALLLELRHSVKKKRV